METHSAIKIVCIVQARMSSSRLPGKVMMPLAGKPVIEQVFHQLSFSRRIRQAMLATSIDPRDEALAAWAGRSGIALFRGSLDNVLDRFYRAARQQAADAVVRVTADCPVIDPDVLDRVIEAFIDTDRDYVTNANPPTFPDGLDCEVFSMAALETAWKCAALQSEIEHVTPYIRNHPERFRLGNVASEANLQHLRWTLDNREDYQLLSAVYDHLYRTDDCIRMGAVLALMERQPELAGLNRHLKRNEGLMKSLQQDKTIKQ